MRSPSASRAGNALTLPRRVAVLLRQVAKTRGSYRDPLFDRPDLVEDDYYRFRRATAPFSGAAEITR
jgi:hypothetical protein